MKRTTLLLIAIPVIITSFIGSQYYFNQMESNRRLSVQVENSYQSAFIDLSSHMESIEEQLAMLMASSSTENQILYNATVWRNIY
ncbi:MAG: germination protein YpeB, partial [Bacillota bacterium]|nr:germination protein YpeB [Bacillota bacterium]